MIGQTEAGIWYVDFGQGRVYSSLMWTREDAEAFASAGEAGL